MDLERRWIRENFPPSDDDVPPEEEERSYRRLLDR